MPLANWAALGTWLLIAISSPFKVGCLPSAYTPTLALLSPLPFKFPPHSKGRVIVCYVTLRMCNARPEAILALLVLICSLTLRLTPTFYMDCTRRRGFAEVAFTVPLMAVLNPDKHLQYSRTVLLSTNLKHYSPLLNQEQNPVAN